VTRRAKIIIGDDGSWRVIGSIATAIAHWKNESRANRTDDTALVLRNGGCLPLNTTALRLIYRERLEDT
jgi:hypothetical protein